MALASHSYTHMAKQLTENGYVRKMFYEGHLSVTPEEIVTRLQQGGYKGELSITTTGHNDGEIIFDSASWKEEDVLQQIEQEDRKARQAIFDKD